MLLVLSFLVPKAFESEKNLPILSSLTEIRRDLAFGRIGADSALRNADIAILGLPVEEKLQEEISDALSFFERWEAESQRVVGDMKRLIDDLPMDVNAITEEQARKAKMIVRRLQQDMNPLLHQGDELHRITRSLRIHSASAQEVAPNKALASTEAISKIDSRFAELGEKFEELNKDWEPTLQRLVRAEQRLGL